MQTVELDSASGAVLRICLMPDGRWHDASVTLPSQFTQGGFGQQAAPKPANKSPEWIAAVTGFIGMLLGVIQGGVNLPWLKWVAMGLGALAILIMVVLGWVRWITPYFVRRWELKVWQKKVIDLPNYVRKFLHEVAAEDSDNTILHNVHSIGQLSDGTDFTGQERTNEAGFLRDLSKAFVERFNQKPRGIHEIRFAFHAFDNIMSRFGCLYASWRKGLLESWNQLGDYRQTALVKTSGTYIKFVEDYLTYRRADDQRAYGLGSLHLRIPDPLPSVSVKPPAPAPTPQTEKAG